MTNWNEGKLLLCGKFECRGKQMQSSFAASSKEKLPSWILLLCVTGNSLVASNVDEDTILTVVPILWHLVDLERSQWSLIFLKVGVFFKAVELSLCIHFTLYDCGYTVFMLIHYSGKCVGSALLMTDPSGSKFQRMLATCILCCRQCCSCCVLCCTMYSDGSGWRCLCMQSIL